MVKVAQHPRYAEHVCLAREHPPAVCGSRLSALFQTRLLVHLTTPYIVFANLFYKGNM